MRGVVITGVFTCIIPEEELGDLYPGLTLEQAMLEEVSIYRDDPALLLTSAETFQVTGDYVQ